MSLRNDRRQQLNAHLAFRGILLFSCISCLSWFHSGGSGPVLKPNSDWEGGDPPRIIWRIESSGGRESIVGETVNPRAIVRVGRGPRRVSGGGVRHHSGSLIQSCVWRDEMGEDCGFSGPQSCPSRSNLTRLSGVSGEEILTHGVRLQAEWRRVYSALPSPGTSAASVAQWQSSGFVNRRLWVRLPPLALSLSP